jgi:hypothetical protein
MFGNVLCRQGLTDRWCTLSAVHHLYGVPAPPRCMPWVVGVLWLAGGGGVCGGSGPKCTACDRSCRVLLACEALALHTASARQHPMGAPRS